MVNKISLYGCTWDVQVAKLFRARLSGYVSEGDIIHEQVQRPKGGKLNLQRFEQRV